MQCQRALKMLRSRPSDVDKYLYLSTIKGENVDLFYRLLIDNARELMPLVYTPTIGDVCLQYSTIYTRPEALYISIKQRKSMKTILRNWPYQNPEICVVTDGSRILGLGDLGINGVGIPVRFFFLFFFFSFFLLLFLSLFCPPPILLSPISVQFPVFLLTHPPP